LEISRQSLVSDLPVGHLHSGDAVHRRRHEIDRRAEICAASRDAATQPIPAEEEVMKADALMRFILSGNRSLEEFAVLLARISLGVFFAISGGNKLFVASQYKLMYETIVGAGIPFPHVMTYFVSSVEFVCGCLLIIGLLSTLCCIAFIIDMIVAITTVQLATITKALSFIDWLDDFLYLPEIMYIIIFLWLISSGPGRLSVDHWIAVRSGLLDGVSADQRATAVMTVDRPRVVILGGGFGDCRRHAPSRGLRSTSL
jgi:putative oxidoreductase